MLVAVDVLYLPLHFIIVVIVFVAVVVIIIVLSRAVYSSYEVS